MVEQTPLTSELRDGWSVVVGSILGIGTGVSALLLYTNGLFVSSLHTEFGLSRTAFGFGLLMVTVALAVANPLVGWAVDRLGARTVAASSLVLLAAGFATMATGVHSARSYIAIQALVALAAAGSGPTAYAKAVSSRFARHRGLALGLALMGIGLSAAIVPPLVARAITAGGWRSGYWLLAAIALLGIVPSLLLVREAPRRIAADDPLSAPGTDRSILRTPFWLMISAFGVMAIGFAGLLPHFVPLLLDDGLSPARAGALAGLIGLAVIASRLVVGFLMDRIFAPFVAIGICLVAIGGCLSLLAFGVVAAPFAALAIGCAMGGEVDLLSFLIARYFGTRSFGRIYGWQYAAFILASGVAPLWIGAVRDRTGDYRLTLLLCIVGLAASMILFARLPRYRVEPAASPRGNADLSRDFT